MTTVTLRSQKAQPLTNQEIDDNFSNLNTNKLESVVYSNCTTSGSGWFRVATTSSDGRGTYNVDIYTTGGNHNPSVLTVHAQGDWLSARILYALWDQQFPASSVRITRSATNTYLEVNFTTSVNTFQIRVNHVGHNTNILGYSGALSAGGDTVCDSVQLIGYVNTSKIYASDVQSSIVYDSDNTSYYLNPASTSVLNALTVGGSSVWTQATLTNLNQLTNGPGYLTSNQTISISGDATGSGSTSIALTLANSGVTAGTYNTLTVDAKGRVTSGSNTSYLTAESDTLASVTARGASTSTALTLSSNSNRLGNLYVGYGTYSNSITPVGDSNMNLDTPSGAVYVTTSIRSPIFYDSNDTSYYTDPAGTSNLNRLDLNTLFLDRNESPSRGISWYSSGYTSWSQYMSPAGTSGSGPTGNITAPSGTYVTSWALRSFIENASGYGWTFESGTGAGQPTVVAEIRSSDGLAKFNGGTYSPIFYDSDNTGYYLDPHSTSRVAKIVQDERYDATNIATYGGIYSGDWQNLTNSTGQINVVQVNNISSGHTNYPASVYTYGGVLSWRATNHSFQLYAAHTGDLAYKTQWSNDNYSGWRYPMVYGYQNGAGGSIYGTILYDQNDTNYYVDPTSTSILNIARINSIQSPNSTSVVAADSAMPNSGHSFIHTLAQGPGGNDGHIFGMTWSGTTSIYGAQLWLDTDPTNKMSLRSRSSVGVWNSWADVITSWSDDQTKTGYFQSNSSLRAPIFYDSNDTGYYINPESNDTTYATRIRSGLLLGPNYTWGAYLLVGGDGKYRTYQDSANVASVVSTDGNLHLDAGSGKIMYINYYDGSSVYFCNGANGVFGEVLSSDSSIRFPIFYDYNDTSYYLDPTAYSRIRQLTVTQSRVDTSRYPLGHYSSGETVFEIDPTWSQDQLREYFGNNSVSWVADSSAPGGYAISIVGGVSVAAGVYGSGFPFIPVEQDDVFYMECWLKDISGSNGHYMGSVDYNENFSSLGGNPGSYGYWVMANNYPGTSWTKFSGYIGGFGNSVGQFESGTKYWSPQALFNYSGQGTSYISGWKVTKVNQRSRKVIQATGLSGGTSTSYQLQIQNSTSVSTSPDITIGADGSYAYIQSWNSKTLLINNQGNSVQFGTDARAPIFYDSNNTGYYFDGASTSKWNESNQDGWHTFNNYGLGVTGTYDSYRLQTVFAMGSAYRISADGTSTNNMYGLAWSHPNAGSLGGANNLNDHGLLIINNGTFRAALSSRAVFSADVRGTLFYDYNDTSYYCDPNSTSFLYRIRSYYIRNPVDVASDHPFGLYFSDGESTAYAIYRESGSWTFPYPDLRIAFHTGIKIGANAGYKGVRFYTDYDMSSLVMSVNNDDYVSGGVYVHSDLRAPIMYDANNTGYYVDPNAGTSINVAGAIVAGGNITAYSDLRLKTDIQPITDAITKVKQIRGVTYNRKDLNSTKRQAGVIAQEVVKVLPEVVDGHENSNYTVAYGNMVALLIEAIKEQQQQIDELKNLVKQLVQ
jgi:hypothetical protein